MKIVKNRLLGIFILLFLSINCAVIGMQQNSLAKFSDSKNESRGSSHASFEQLDTRRLQYGNFSTEPSDKSNFQLQLYGPKPAQALDRSKIFIRGTMELYPRNQGPSFMAGPEFLKQVSSELGYSANFDDLYNYVWFKNSDGQLITTPLIVPTEKLFACNNGTSFRMITSVRDIDVKCIASKSLPGKDFQEQFEIGCKNFIKDPLHKNEDLFISATVELRKANFIKTGLVNFDGSQGPNGYPTEAHLRQKMISQRSNGAIGKHNIALSILKRGQGGSSFSRREDLQLQKKQEEERRAREAAKFMIENPGHGVNKPASASNRGDCIVS
jgi:hypothetical protein